MVILLLVAVVLIVPVHRCTVRNPARGYAEKSGNVLNRRKPRRRKAPLTSSERTVFVFLVPSVGQRSFQRAAESPSRTGGDTRARAPKLIWARERQRFLRNGDRPAEDPKMAAASDFHSSAPLEREPPWQAVQTRAPSRQPTPR